MGAALHQVVDRARDAPLVTRDWVRGYYDRVFGSDLDRAVGPVCDPAQGRQGLPCEPVVRTTMSESGIWLTSRWSTIISCGRSR